MSEKLSVTLGVDKGELKLADGRKFEIKPLTIWDLALLQDYCQCELEQLMDKLKSLKNMLFLIHLALGQQITQEEVGKLFPIQNLNKLNEVVPQILKLSGLMVEEPKNVEGPTS